MRQAFIGVDVGTSSARAGVFDETGTLLATARHPITTWHEAGDVVEQSSSEIWAACAASVRAAMAEAAIPPRAVKGIGFDATCSLVVLDADGAPLTVSASGDPSAQCHRLDGPSRDRRSARGQRDAGRRAALCRRLDLAGDGDSQAALAEAASAVELSMRPVISSISPTFSPFARPARRRARCARVTCKWNFSPTNSAGARSYFERVGLGRSRRRTTTRRSATRSSRPARRSAPD